MLSQYFNPAFLLMLIIFLHYLIHPQMFDFIRPKADPVEFDHSYGTPAVSTDGTQVRSKGEKIIADWLASHSIPFVYEPKINGMLPDFYIKEKNTIIEYWGMANVMSLEGTIYRFKMIKKMDKYSRMNVNLINIYPNQLKELDSLLAPLVLAK